MLIRAETTRIRSTSNVKYIQLTELVEISDQLAKFILANLSDAFLLGLGI